MLVNLLTMLTLSLKSKNGYSAVCPPLIKGYLRIGAYVGEGVFVDHQFGTTDVMIVTLIDQTPDRYKQHFRQATGLDRKN